MFESVNLEELTKIVKSVITPEVVSEGKMWQLSDDQRNQIRVAMFGRGKSGAGIGDVSAQEQRELVSEFKKKVAGPIIASLSPHTGAWAMLMLYEEFVDAVFVQAVLRPDVGGGD